MKLPGVPSQYFAVLANLVEESGQSPDQLFVDSDLKLADLYVPDQWLEYNDFVTAVERAYDLTGNQSLALVFGSRLNISSHTSLGYALMNCNTLGQAVELFLRYYRIIAFHIDLKFTVQGEDCFFTLEVNENNPLRDRFSYECFFSSLYSTVRYLLRDEPLDMWLEIAAPEPVYGNTFRQLFGDKVRFNTPQHRIGCAARLLELPLEGANPALVKIYERQCDNILARLKQGASQGEKVRTLLENCQGAFPNHQEAAKLLATSPRTLRRKLSQEGTSYQQILDDIRSARAVSYLQDSKLPLSSIAYMLGFNDVSNFRRAFLRWTGKKPLDYRRPLELGTSSFIDNQDTPPDE